MSKQQKRICDMCGREMSFETDYGGCITAEMSIIEIIEDKQKRLEREKEYIIHYIHNENYICINKVFSDKRKYNAE